MTLLLRRKRRTTPRSSTPARLLNARRESVLYIAAAWLLVACLILDGAGQSQLNAADAARTPASSPVKRKLKWRSPGIAAALPAQTPIAVESTPSKQTAPKTGLVIQAVYAEPTDPSDDPVGHTGPGLIAQGHGAQEHSATSRGGRESRITAPMLRSAMQAPAARIDPLDEPTDAGLSPEDEAMEQEELSPEDAGSEAAADPLEAEGLPLQPVPDAETGTEEPQPLRMDAEESRRAIQGGGTPDSQMPSIEDALAARPDLGDPCPPTDHIKRIRQITTNIKAEEGLFPKECLLTTGDFEERVWTDTLYTWKASSLCHKPLYFEEVALERYGHTWGPFLQPVISGAHFFGTVPLLPYKMGIEPPKECVYALGYYRPGSCAPYMIPPIPLSLRGAALEGAAVAGGIIAIP